MLPFSPKLENLLSTDLQNTPEAISPKGQLISICLFGAIVSTKNTNEIFLRISALASKKSWNQENKGTLLY